MNTLPLLDFAAFAWFVAIVGAFEITSAHPRFYPRTIAAAVQKQRDAWMLRMSQSDVRIFDGQLMGWLSNANPFFASTSIIVIGGLGALIGYGEKARAIIDVIPGSAKDSAALWEIKVIFLMALMTFAFFKFAWAFRLSHYTVIMLGAMPESHSADETARLDHAWRTARLLGLVGEHSNRGLRSFYYTIAALMWFYHPLTFIAATTWIVLILVRREYTSTSRGFISGDLPRA